MKWENTKGRKVIKTAFVKTEDDNSHCINIFEGRIWMQKKNYYNIVISCAPAERFL